MLVVLGGLDRAGESTQTCCLLKPVLSALNCVSGPSTGAGARCLGTFQRCFLADAVAVHKWIFHNTLKKIHAHSKAPRWRASVWSGLWGILPKWPVCSDGHAVRPVHRDEPPALLAVQPASPHPTSRASLPEQPSARPAYASSHPGHRLSCLDTKTNLLFVLRGGINTFSGRMCKKTEGLTHKPKKKNSCLLKTFSNTPVSDSE